MRTTPLKIQSTKDYDIFESNPLQKTFKETTVAKIQTSMSAYGFWPNCPISVYKKPNGKFGVNGGHHRLAAAKNLGIPVFYVIEDEWDTTQLTFEGAFSGAWPLKDKVIAHAKEGKKDFQELLEVASHGIPINLVASMMRGEAASSGNARKSLSDGTFKIRSRVQTDCWLALHDEFDGRAPAICHRPFIQAYSKCLMTPEFENEVFVRRLRNNPTALEKTSNEDQALKLIEEIYNFRSPNKIPLAFIVTTASKARQRSFGKEAKSA